VPHRHSGELREHSVLSAGKTRWRRRATFWLQPSMATISLARQHLSTVGNITLSDIGVTIPELNCLPPALNPNYPLIPGDTLSPLVLTTALSQATVTANAAAVNQVVAGFIPQVATSQTARAGLGLYHLHAVIGREQYQAALLHTGYRCGLCNAGWKRGFIDHGARGRRVQSGQHAVLCLHSGRQSDPLHQRAYPHRQASRSPNLPACTPWQRPRLPVFGQRNRRAGYCYSRYFRAPPHKFCKPQAREAGLHSDAGLLLLIYPLPREKASRLRTIESEHDQGISFLRPAGSAAVYERLASFFSALGFAHGRGWDEDSNSGDSSAAHRSWRRWATWR